MRVFSDTRFARDKTPYKTNIGIQFRHELGKDVHAPGFYLHIDNGHIFGYACEPGACVGAPLGETNDCAADRTGLLDMVQQRLHGLGVGACQCVGRQGAAVQFIRASGVQCPQFCS